MQALGGQDIPAMAFENPDEWIGRQGNSYQVPWDQFEQAAGEGAHRMYRWFNDYGYEADIAALRKEHPGLVSFEHYLCTHGWENAQPAA